MPVGRSGRIVVEFDPELKRRLHARLRSEGRDFRSWLLERVYDYLEAPREGERAARESEEAPPGLSELERRVLDVLLRLELQGCIVQQFGRCRRVRPS